MPKASSSFKFKLEGLAEAERTLKEFVPRHVKRIVNRATKKGAAVFLAGAQRRVPVDTGALQMSLRLKSRRSKKKDRIAYQVQTGQSQFLNRNDSFYAVMQELGWTDIKGTFHAGQPFLRPTAEEDAPQAASVFTNELKNGIARQVKRQAKR